MKNKNYIDLNVEQELNNNKETLLYLQEYNKIVFV